MCRGGEDIIGAPKIGNNFGRLSNLTFFHINGLFSIATSKVSALNLLCLISGISPMFLFFIALL